MQIIVVYFPYHIRLKKAIAQVVSKIKSADLTNVLVFHYLFIITGSLFLLAKWLSFLLTKHL
jgi:predicted AlkP superfamily phosphohydrolase/phosphomutase